MLKLRKRVPLLVRGAATYAAGQQARIDFSDIPPLPTAETYVEGIMLRFDGTWATGGAGDTYDETVLQQIFDSIIHKTPGGHVWYDLPSQAGLGLHRLFWAMKGRRPATEPNGSGTVLGGGAVTTIVLTNAAAVRIFAFVPYSALGGARPRDCNVALRDLIGSQLLIQFPNASNVNGHIFDTGADNQGFSAGTLSAHAILRGEDDYIASTPFSVTQHDLSGLEENLPFLNGKVLHWLIEHQVQATATTTQTNLTDANRDEVNLSFAGIPATERMDMRQLVEEWNFTHARTRSEHLPNVETGVPFAPHFFPDGNDWSLLDGIRGGIDVKLRVSGTESTPRVIAFYTGLNSPANLTQRLERNRLRVPDGFGKDASTIKIDSAGGGAVGPGAEGAQRLPVRIPADQS